MRYDCLAHFKNFRQIVDFSPDFEQCAVAHSFRAKACKLQSFLKY